MNLKNHLRLLLLIFFNLSIVNSHIVLSQTPSCPCSGSKCALTASDLYNILTNTQNPLQPGDVVTVCGTINLGELVPSGTQPPNNLFPLIVPDFVTVQGNFNFYGGTTINFPFLYQGGLKCGHQQFANVNDMPPGGDNNGDEPFADDEQMAHNNNSNSSPSPLSIANMAFVFRLGEGSMLKNLCITGPKTDTKEQVMTYTIDKIVNCNGNTTNVLPPIQGMAGGVYMKGKDSRIENCEIYGFPLYGVYIQPDVSSDHGNVYIDRCYIHNNKAWGWGYGVWLSGGGGSMTCDHISPACSTWQKVPNGNPPVQLLPAKIQNSPIADMVLYLSNTFFFENGKDFDSSGDRNSVIIDHCTFSERVPAGANIHRHEDADLCNDVYQINDPVVCPVTPTPTNPTPNYAQACNLSIDEVGGNHTWIQGSFFYKGGYEIQMQYPNIFDPYEDVNSTCYQNATPFGALTPLVHIGRNINAAPPDNRTGWNYFINENTNQFGRIFIANTDIKYWDIADPYIEVIHHPQNSVMDGQNIYVSNASQAPVPMLEITSTHPSTGTGNPDLITQGEDVEFYTTNCRDAAHDFNTDMVYMWRFHEQRYDHQDEIRTAALGTGPGGGLRHSFNNIGITNVNLMAIDVNNNFAASNIATQQITIQPSAGNNDVVLVVNIKDSYDGRNLIGPVGCRYDRTDSTLNVTGLWDHLNPIDHTPTGFVLFIEINGEEIWSQDIAADDGGWQYLTFNIEDYVLTNVPCGCSDMIEIGIRPSGHDGADAAMVRGVSIYVDDVYIRSINGYNALANGDFEELDGSWPASWILTDNNISYTLCTNPPASAATSSSGGRNERDEVRSGHYAYWGRIKSLADNVPYYTGMTYNGGYVYKSVKQEFNILNPPPPRLAQPKAPLQANFQIQPNPSSINRLVNGMFTSLPPDNDYTINVIAPDGSTVYSKEGTGYEFSFNSDFPPGVYYVNIKSKNYSGFRKMVVVN
ncbi:MAG TPA: T9SS type A sorting domain-containing protein [Bacteroidia bacterium]|nr:T9SS type A sorting domain-containing protein [Bacteroidia bacterium]HNU34396.1 T9SS type A sorting domain-containing protein [Bacteroidia bacterium]